ncbi:MAG: SIMPL domain-containing protein [bacterium]
MLTKIINTMELLNNKYFKWLTLGVLGFLALFLAASTLYQLKNVGELDYNKPVTNSITVSGQGEAVAIPDIATFSFSVTKEAKTSAEAQKLVTDASSKVLDAVKKDGVEDKDVKTTNYSLYPKYDYPQTVCPAIYPSNCPPAKEVLRGYEVSQSFEVKIRSTDKVGQIVSDVTSAGVTNINGPTFGVDNEDAVIAQARNEAIANAKSKAESIAKGLGVKLVRIVNFSENENGYVAPMMNSFAVGSADMKSAPQLPAGENKYSRTVNITYEIR